MTITEVNSVMIPARFVTICNGWYGGSDDLLYTVYSTGNLTTGTIRPLECDTDQKWYFTLWCDLSVDVGRARHAAESQGNKYAHDAVVLGEFEEWVDALCERLSEEYGF